MVSGLTGSTSTALLLFNVLVAPQCAASTGMPLAQPTGPLTDMQQPVSPCTGCCRSPN